MITKIESPRDLKGGVWYRQYAVKDEAEALRIVGTGTGMLYQSTIIKALFLFVEVAE